MDKKDFNILNQQRKINGEVLFANPRNAAAGSLKLLDSSLVAERRLNFFAHSLGELKGRSLSDQWVFLGKLREWGVRANANSLLCDNLGQVIELCKTWQEKREKLPYEIDGIVVKVNSFSHHYR